MSAKMEAGKPDYDDAYDEDDFDEEYFLLTYQPLSNLPTPPPSCRDSIASLSSRGSLQQDVLLESSLLGPAVHLVNLIPPTASLATPQVSTVHEILARASLPSETIALAVCILDSLNAKFSQTWRISLPLASLDQHAAHPSAGLHIDAVGPELIVLASLILAVKFLEDWQEPTSHFASRWGGGLWTCEQINVTERCIMESLGYRIMPLWDQGLIKGALADMERAGTPANLDRQRFGSTISRFGSTTSARHQPVTRKVVIVSGGGPGAMQVTPQDTPKFGRVAWASVGTGAAASSSFGSSSGAGSQGLAALTGRSSSTGGPAGGLDPLHLPPPGVKLDFPPLPSPPMDGL